MKKPDTYQDTKPPQPQPPRRQIQPRANINYTPMTMMRMQTASDEVNTSVNKVNTPATGHQSVHSAASNRARAAVFKSKIVRRPTLSMSGISDIHTFVNVRTPNKQYVPLRTIASSSNEMSMIDSTDDLNQRVIAPNILSPNAMT